MKRFAVLVFCLALLGIWVFGAQPAAQSNVPQYTRDGKLIRPANYRQWVFLSSGLGMNYGPTRNDSGPPSFTNVFAQPEAYQVFLQTGRWPDKTILVLEVYSSATAGSINKSGRFQTELQAVEAHVKDSSRKGDLWKFYDVGSNAAAAAFPDGNACTQCHTQNGAVENTFVQFYPTLLKVAREKGTLKPGVDVTVKQ